MSRENVEVVRGIHEAVARRDYVTPFETYAENVVWEVSHASWTALGIEPVYQGHDGIRQFWRDVLSVIGEFDLEVEELIDVGDQVVAVARERGVGRAKGNVTSIDEPSSKQYGMTKVSGGRPVVS
jgi:ketosteroid isomerase-like protein